MADQDLRDIDEVIAQALRSYRFGGEVRPIWPHLPEAYREGWLDHAGRLRRRLERDGLKIVRVHQADGGS